MTAQTKNKFTVVIDAGHGGRDGGALGKRFKEKNINLSVALKLGELIKSNQPDVKVVYTRNNDVFVDLKDRARIANNAKGDLFISIHTNSVEKNRNKVLGASTYALGLHRSEENLEVAKLENSVILLEENFTQSYDGFDPNSTESYIIFELIQGSHLEQSLQFASSVQKELSQTANRLDKGVRQAGFLVLVQTSMPAVLIELDFICNPVAEAFLGSEEGQNKLARSIYNAFCNYKKKQSKDSNNVNTKILAETKDSLSEIEQKNNNSDNTTTEPEVEEIQSSDKVIYKIQIFSYHSKLPLNSSKFKGLSNISYYKEGNLYKYTYGNTSDYKQIKKDWTKAKTKFKDAFIIRFKDGKRISK